MSEDFLFERHYISQLYDHYHALLSDKQQEVLSLYFEEDLSLSEISAEMGISRQAVHNHLNRARRFLESYEEHMKLNEFSHVLDDVIEEMEAFLVDDNRRDEHFFHILFELRRIRKEYTRGF